MRKTALVLASVAFAMVVLGGVAWAANIQCPKSHPRGGYFPVCEGTKKADRLIGTSTVDDMYGRRGDDTMYGLDSPGGQESDNMYGGDGSDKLYGGPGVDRFVVGPNGRDDLVDDYVHGGRNADELGSPVRDGTVQRGVDRFYDDDGDDRIHVEYNAGPEDSAKDVVTCGPGTDRVWFNEGVDIVDAATCETRLSLPFPQQ